MVDSFFSMVVAIMFQRHEFFSVGMRIPVPVPVPVCQYTVGSAGHAYQSQDSFSKFEKTIGHFVAPCIYIDRNFAPTLFKFFKSKWEICWRASSHRKKVDLLS